MNKKPQNDDDLQARLAQARLYFERHHANVQPDPAFVDRVTASLAPADLLGWAAWRLLPASVALVLVLAWFSLQTGPELELEVSESPMDNLLSWVLEETP